MSVYDDETVALCIESKKRGKKKVAEMAIAALRNVRDNHYDEWMNLLKADEDNIMVTLWDYLKETIRDGE